MVLCGPPGGLDEVRWVLGGSGAELLLLASGKACLCLNEGLDHDGQGLWLAAAECGKDGHRVATGGCPLGEQAACRAGYAVWMPVLEGAKGSGRSALHSPAGWMRPSERKEPLSVTNTFSVSNNNKWSSTF